MVKRLQIMVSMALMICMGVNLFAANKNHASSLANHLLMPSPAHTGAFLKGIKIDPQDPFKIRFIVDTADDKKIDEAQLKKLIRYFLAVLTIPEKDLWVNLSPYEANRIIPAPLSQTDLGRDLLNSDYLLKQLAASLTYPKTPSGKKYWQEKGGPHDGAALSKVWIMPKAARIYEQDNAAIILKAQLKAMVKNDSSAAEDKAFKANVLPLIEQEINQGKHFADLRQIYASFILATWFKHKLQDAIFKYYIGQNKTAGIKIADKEVKEKIYARYIQAFRDGAYDYTKTDYDPMHRTVTKQKYYSGGILLKEGRTETTQDAHEAEGALREFEEIPTVVELRPAEDDLSDSLAQARSRITYSPEEFTAFTQALMEEMKASLGAFGRSADISKHQRKTINRSAKEMILRGMSPEEARESFRQYLTRQVKLATENIISDPSRSSEWFKAGLERYQVSRASAMSSEDFVASTARWIKERFGADIDRKRVLFSRDSSDPGHLISIFDVVIYRLIPGINSVSYWALYHEFLHFSQGGFSIQWMDEAMTEKLTREFFDEMGKAKLGELPQTNYVGARESLEILANVVGWGPLAVSYITGEEGFLTEALGENGGLALRLMEIVGYFRNNKISNRLILGVLSNLQSRDKLLKIRDAIAVFLDHETKNIEQWKVRNDAVLEELQKLQGPQPIAGRLSLSPETYDKVVRFSQDASNPTLQKYAREMLQNAVKKDKALGGVALKSEGLALGRQTSSFLIFSAAAIDKIKRSSGFTFDILEPGLAK